MASRSALIIMLIVAFNVSLLHSSEKSQQLEIMLKLITQNQSLKLTPEDSLHVWVQTEADSAESNRLMNTLQRLSKNSDFNIPFSFYRIQSVENALSALNSPDAVLFLNSQTIPLSREVRDFHRLGAVTVTSMPDYMDIGVSIAVQKDSTDQEIIWLNPRAVEQAGARFSTDVLQLTKTRYARGSEL